MVRGILGTFGIRALRVTANPVDAYKMFKDSPPDLIFSDWAPGLDGIEFLENVRKNSTSPNPFVPFVMTTAHTSIEDVCTARDAGISEFLAKPLTAKLIYSRICSVIERRRVFIRNRSYFGPNRRRRTINDFGHDRRSHVPLTVVNFRKGQTPLKRPESRTDYSGRDPQESRRVRRA